MVHAPDAAVVSLVSVVVLFSHGLQPRSVDHKQMLMMSLTAALLKSRQRAVVKNGEKCQLHVGTTAPTKIPREEVGSRWRLLPVKTTSRDVEKAAAITLTAANTVAANSTAMTTNRVPTAFSTTVVDKIHSVT